MCLLCDSLHANFGLKGRFYTNYDLTACAILIESLTKQELNLSNPSKLVCIRPIFYKKPPEIYTFLVPFQ